MSPDTQNTSTVDEKERQILESWYASGTVAKYLQKNQNSEKRFSFLDGPITANNPMGVHHGWGRTYKDVFQRYYNAKGYAQRFQNGFDCQGLWVEVEVEKSLGLKSKREIENLVSGDKKASIAKFIALCKERVNHFASIQTQQSKRLGYLMDWDHSYYTMSDANNYAIWHFLQLCYQNDWIYRDLDTVPWCVRCGTSISQHEILTEDYKEVTHQSVLFALALDENPSEKLLVWTTTAWTIPGNVAVALDPNAEYDLLEGSDGKSNYWIAKLNKENYPDLASLPVKKTCLGSQLVGKTYQGAIDAKKYYQDFELKEGKQIYVIVATDEHVLPISASEGTGFVHLAPSAGEEDHKLAAMRALAQIELIDEDGNFLLGHKLLHGQNATHDSSIIFDLLKKLSSTDHEIIYRIIPYTHRYPACWRCKTDLVWRMVDEWYIAMDRPSKKTKDSKDLGKTLRERLTEVAKTINWLPSFGLERELDWLEKMHDWMISKKRYWGLCLPIWVCENCAEFEVIGSKQELVERSIAGIENMQGQSPHRPQLDEVVISCQKCQGRSYRIPDVGNPWLDAGIVPFSTIASGNDTELPSYFSDPQEFAKWFPVDFITESFPGQFRNWFYSLLVMSTVLEGVAPFKNVLGFATCLAEDGRAMHKSWGNSIEFNEGASQMGVDIMRFMYCSTNPAVPLLFGFKRAESIKREFFLLLKNSAKYVIDNQQQFNESEFPSLEIIDKWLMSKLNSQMAKIEQSFAQYDVASVCSTLQELLGDFSLWYIRRIRERITTGTSREKYAASYTMKQFMSQYLIICSIITPFIADELYSQLNPDALESVILQDFPSIDSAQIDKNLEQDMELVREICSIGNRIRKELSVKLRQPLASLSIQAPMNFNFKSNSNQAELLELIKSELNVKAISFQNADLEEFKLVYDTNMTPELVNEGLAREIIRKVQIERKNLNLSSSQKIKLYLPEYPLDFAEHIKQKATISEILKGDFRIELG